MKNLALKIISYILWGLGTAAIFGYFAYIATVNSFKFIPDGLLFIVFALISLLTASGVHELGHFVFGLFSGMRALLTIKSLLPSLRSSSVEIIPKKENKIKSRLIITSLGGIFFNFLFIALGFVALFVPQVPIWISPIAVFHLSLFFDNALPIMHKTGKSDGLMICGLIKNTPESQVTLAVLKVQAHILAGKPISEVEKTYLFGLPQIAEDDPAFISLCELRAEYSEAVGDMQNAAVYRARFEELKKEYLD